MTMTDFRLPHRRTRFLTSLLVLFWATSLSAAPKQEVERGEELAFAREILRSPEDAGPQVEALGHHLMREPEVARKVLADLERQGSETDLLRAELLWEISSGWHMGWRSKGAATMPTYEICERVAPLLDSRDPAVRMLAEWAMDIALSRESEGNYPRPWPDAGKHSWYARWLEVAGNGRLQLANDYMREAFLEGAHRDGSRLLALAEDRVRRAGFIAERVERLGAPEDRADVEAKTARMEAMLSRMREMVRSGVPVRDIRHQYLLTRKATRNVVMTNPDIHFDQALFAVRNNNNANNITQGDLPHVFGAEGEIFIKDGLDPESPVRPLLGGRLGQGHLRGLDLHWDADRILFSWVEMPKWEELMASREEDYQKLLEGDIQTKFFSAWGAPNDAKRAWWCGRAHLWEMDLGSGELKQLTDAEWNDDYEPAYLPNGDILFVSDRSMYGSQCAGNPGQDKMITNLHRARGDGSGIYAMSNNKDFDRFPRVMEDGTFLFLHWEYQERHLWLPHTLWRARPDGTNLDTLYKQHIEHTPMSLRHARQIPGKDKVMAIACGHHVGSIGSVFLVDYSKGINEGDAMRKITPQVDNTEWNYGPWKTVEEGGVPDKGGYYHNPWPLSEKSLIASYSYNRDNAMARSYALYYLDVWGNKELIHRDPKLSTTYFFPFEKRKTPPVIPDQVDPTRQEAYVYTGDVYEGTDIEPGAIKYIRVSQHMPWPCVRDTETHPEIGFDDLHYNPSGPWSHIMGYNGWSPARSIGIVPVEEDGSAYFKVPVRQPIYFQALDENYMEVRRMRSMVTLQPGENRGCVGCHETRTEGPDDLDYGAALALQRMPSMPLPPSWGAAEVPSFEEHIQPILNRHCVECHGQDDPAGGIELTGRKIGGHFQSYRTMFGLKANEKTPARELHVLDWYPDDPNYTTEGHKEFYKGYFNNENPGQLVSIADYKSGIEVTQPYQFGSHKSKLITVLIEDELHKEKVEMSRQDWIDLVTWVDLNAFYHSSYTYFTTMERVPVKWPDPWQRAPAGEFQMVEIDGKKTVVLPE